MVEIKLRVMGAKSEGYCERNGMGRVNVIVNTVGGMSIESKAGMVSSVKHITEAIGRGNSDTQDTHLPLLDTDVLHGG